MMNKEKNFVSAVIYVHNAASGIEAFLKAIVSVLEQNFEHSEIICVNDFSDDASVEIIRNASQYVTTTSISILNMSSFHGLELAMKAGVDFSIGDFVFEFDQPILDFESEIIMNVYRRALDGFDIVSASSDKKDKLSSRVFYRIFDLFSDLSYRMNSESFRILSRRVINRVGAMNKTVMYRKAMYAESGLKSDNLKYTSRIGAKRITDRKEKRYRFSLAADSLILFTDVGYKFSVMMTGIMMILSIFMLIYSITVYFTSMPVAGWTTTILFLSVVFFGLFGLLTIIIKYLQLIVNLVFKRQHYSFESIEKLTR